jgi:glycosyltransferase involved in cell wall biosynthesis
MNILLVAPWPLDAAGGVSNAVSMLYEEFAAAGHRVAALIPTRSPGVTPVADSAGREVYGLYLRSPVWEGKDNLRSWLTFWLFLPLTLLRLARFLRRHEVDVVHIHYPLASLAYLGMLRLFCGWRLVVTYQGNDAHDLTIWQPIERRLIRCLLNAADTVTGVSPTLLTRVRTAVPKAAFHEVSIPNGAAVDRIERNSDVPFVAVPETYVVSVGHLIKRKGIDLLIEALRLLRDSGDGVHAVLVGDGSDRAEFERLARERGVADRLTFVGNQSHDQAIAIVRRSAFFVLASRAEGLPLVIAEAMACRKTVVATAVDGVPEIVLDRDTGLLVAPENPVALAEAIRVLHRDAAYRDRLADRAYRRAVESFSWRIIARRYLDVYRAPRSGA